jgi:NAD(P)H-dependent FMN reductase
MAMIGIVVGTNRVGSKSRLVAAQLARIYSKLEQKVSIIDLGLMPKEAWSGTSFKKTPQSILPMINQTIDSQGLVFVFPEYNGSIPGPLKQYIDLLPRQEALEKKPVCLVGVTRGNFGTMRASMHLESILFYRRALIFPFSLYLPKIDELFNNKSFIEEPNVQRKMMEQSKNFLEFMQRNQIHAKEP